MIERRLEAFGARYVAAGCGDVAACSGSVAGCSRTETACIKAAYSMIEGAWDVLWRCVLELCRSLNRDVVFQFLCNKLFGRVGIC